MCYNNYNDYSEEDLRQTIESNPITMDGVEVIAYMKIDGTCIHKHVQSCLFYNGAWRAVCLSCGDVFMNLPMMCTGTWVKARSL